MALKKLACVLIVTLLSLPTLGFASHHYGCHYGKMNSWNMTELDTDGDGQLTYDEFVAPRTERWQAGFNGIDTDLDGRISVDEWNVFLQVHGMIENQ